MMRTPRSEKMIETLEAWERQYDFLPIKEIDALIASIRKSAKLIDVSVNEKFKNMVKDRQSVKYVGMSEKDFNAMLKKQIEDAKALYERSKKLSPDDVKKFEEMTKKAATARRKNVGGKGIDDMLKDLDK
jgi:hypothetical protein